jgi:DUF4097 and DUF4098 domain-containing protein YvlB
MSRDQIIKIGMVVLVVVLVCAVIITSTGMFGSSGGYANAEKYTSGDTEIQEDIKKIDVTWTSGKVTVAYHTENTIGLKESAKRALSGDEKLQWWVDGDTLRVQFTKPGIRWNMPEKELTITLPEGIRLTQANIGTTSGEIEIPEMKAEVLILDSTSGDIRACVETDKAEVNATSGEQQLEFRGTAEQIRVNSTSGNIRVEAEKAMLIEAASTSGSIGIQAQECQSAKANSTSGNIDAELGKMEQLSISATSGSVTAKLPETPGFTATVDTTSGSFTYGLALAREGNKYICGDGSGSVNIDTTSGNVRIDRLN